MNLKIVLIETLWNLKGKRRKTTKQPTRVLIETLWNVKKIYPARLFQESTCINRNIVECKVMKERLKLNHVLVLIETLWNVKNS